MKSSIFSYCQERLTPRYGMQEAGSLAAILLEDAFGYKEHHGKAFDTAQKGVLDAYLKRLEMGEPLQYMLGEADFLGLKIKVSPAVLIPRMETEELADWLRKSIQKQKANARILDIGTGSGCIPVYIKKKCPEARIDACDISIDALQIAEKNAAHYRLPIDFLTLDILDKELWDVLPHYDYIVSNPPYIPPSEKKHIPEHVLAHEPGLALFSPEQEPLVFYKVIADFSSKKLNNNGFLFFECNEFNAQEVVQILQKKGFQNIELRQDIMGKDRMIRAEWRA